MLFSSLFRPLLFKLDEELAHDLAVRALSASMVCTGAETTIAKNIIASKKLHVKISGLDFLNPLGLAAGFDKNGQAMFSIEKLGFGFMEIGTVTPRPQDGNPKPRLFRLVPDESLINRMGFNNHGANEVYSRLVKYKQKKSQRESDFIVGVNIGANKDSADRVFDYITGFGKFYSLADYFTVNISSPNTPNLRDLQLKDNLAHLLSQLSEAREQKSSEYGYNKPVFVKISPDLTDIELEEMLAIVVDSDVDGIIVSNTTIDRDNVTEGPNCAEVGGLSGRLLFEKSTKMLAKTRDIIGDKKHIIAAGGVSDAGSFIEKIKAGADLVQLYTAMIYQGPGIVINILKDVLKQMEKDGINHISQYKNLEIKKWLES